MAGHTSHSIWVMWQWILAKKSRSNLTPPGPKLQPTIWDLDLEGLECASPLGTPGRAGVSFGVSRPLSLLFPPFLLVDEILFTSSTSLLPHDWRVMWHPWPQSWLLRVSRL